MQLLAPISFSLGSAFSPGKLWTTRRKLKDRKEPIEVSRRVIAALHLPPDGEVKSTYWPWRPLQRLWVLFKFSRLG